MKLGNLTEGLSLYLQSIQAYGTIGAFEDIHNCMVEIIGYHCDYQSPLTVQLLEQIRNVYNQIERQNTWEQEEML